jgi:hypothetical protein
MRGKLVQHADTVQYFERVPYVSVERLEPGGEHRCNMTSPMSA